MNMKIFNRYEIITDTDLNSKSGSPKIVSYKEDEKSNYMKPYLILDIRLKEAFDRGHLLQARNFPNTLLRRFLL